MEKISIIVTALLLLNLVIFFYLIYQKKRVKKSAEALKYHKIKTRTLSEAAKKRDNSCRKFYKLEDSEWLYNQYVNLKKTSSKIAEELGTVSPNVLRALKKLKITVRTNSEAQKLVTHKSKYAVLNDPIFLEKSIKIKALHLSPVRIILNLVIASGSLL